MKQKFKVSKEELSKAVWLNPYSKTPDFIEIEGELIKEKTKHEELKEALQEAFPVDPQCKPSELSNCQPIVNQCKPEEGKCGMCEYIQSLRDTLGKPATPHKIEQLYWGRCEGLNSYELRKINELVEAVNKIRDHLNQQ